MRRLIPLLALALVAQGTTAAEVQVRPNGDRIDVIATAAPLQEILTRLSQQTGMKVVYDGTPPRTLVTVSLVERTPAEAVLRLFEGLGLNYALASDRTGTRVEMLIISAATGGTSPPRSSAPVAAQTPDPRRGPQRPPPTVDEEREEDQQDENAQKPQTPPTPQGPVIFQGPIPGPGRPGSPFGGGGVVGPLTFPTPPAANAPTPAPQPTPTPGSDLG